MSVNIEVMSSGRPGSNRRPQPWQGRGIGTPGAIADTETPAIRDEAGRISLRSPQGAGLGDTVSQRTVLLDGFAYTTTAPDRACSPTAAHYARLALDAAR